MSGTTPLSRPKRHYPRVSHATARLAGNAVVLALLFVGIAVWIAIGAWWAFPAPWLLLTNLTGTVSVFLVLLLLQHARRVNMLAVQTKLDELILSSDAGNHMVGSHRLDAAELEQLRVVHHRKARSRSA